MPDILSYFSPRKLLSTPEREELVDVVDGVESDLLEDKTKREDEADEAKAIDHKQDDVIEEAEPGLDRGIDQELLEDEEDVLDYYYDIETSAETMPNVNWTMLTPR